MAAVFNLLNLPLRIRRRKCDNNLPVCDFVDRLLSSSPFRSVVVFARAASLSHYLPYRSDCAIPFDKTINVVNCGIEGAAKHARARIGLRFSE
jgi:hypothetical protein